MDVVISSALTSQLQNSAQAATQTESNSVKSIESETGMQGTASESGTSLKYDTLELSQDYLNYKTQNENSTLDGDTNQLNSMTSQELPAGESSSENEEDTVNSYELYSYSDSELKTLVSDGTITRAQYNTEMAKRSNSIEE